MDNINFWQKTNDHRYDRPDGAAVRYMEKDNYMYAKPWLSGHRGWVAYPPKEEYPLSYFTKRGLRVAIKYKLAKFAMAKVDKLFPFDNHVN